ncbi:DUF7697 family protein [Sphingobium abikonense]|uniref:DUF7697 family protein n=1 Tax=Sphingobium abikonense TaxID=86193 RepID=UPI0035142486
MVSGCIRQLRAGMGAPYALDFGAVLSMGTAQGADMTMLAELLPSMERILLDKFSEEAPDDGTA